MIISLELFSKFPDHFIDLLSYQNLDQIIFCIEGLISFRDKYIIKN